MSYVFEWSGQDGLGGKSIIHGFSDIHINDKWITVNTINGEIWISPDCSWHVLPQEAYR